MIRVWQGGLGPDSHSDQAVWDILQDLDYFSIKEWLSVWHNINKKMLDLNMSGN